MKRTQAQCASVCARKSRRGAMPPKVTNHLGGKVHVKVPDDDGVFEVATAKNAISVAKWILKDVRRYCTGCDPCVALAVQQPSVMDETTRASGVFLCPAEVVVPQWEHHGPPNGHIGQFAPEKRWVRFCVLKFADTVKDKLPDGLLQELGDAPMLIECGVCNRGGKGFTPWVSGAGCFEWSLTFAGAGGVTKTVACHPDASGSMTKPIADEDRGPPLDPAVVGIARAKQSNFGGAGWKGNQANHPTTTDAAVSALIGPLARAPVAPAASVQETQRVAAPLAVLDIATAGNANAAGSSQANSDMYLRALSLSPILEEYANAPPAPAGAVTTEAPAAGTFPNNPFYESISFYTKGFKLKKRLAWVSPVMPQRMSRQRRQRRHQIGSPLLATTEN